METEIEKTRRMRRMFQVKMIILFSFNIHRKSKIIFYTAVKVNLHPANKGRTFFHSLRNKDLRTGQKRKKNRRKRQK